MGGSVEHDHGDCCAIPLAAYVAGARRDLAGMAFAPGHDTNIIHHLLLEIDRLTAELDEAQVRSIVARNPGIDESEVRHIRSQSGR